jgi:hypothetical protein
LALAKQYQLHDAVGAVLNQLDGTTAQISPQPFKKLDRAVKVSTMPLTKLFVSFLGGQ